MASKIKKGKSKMLTGKTGGRRDKVLRKRKKWLTYHMLLLRDAIGEKGETHAKRTTCVLWATAT